MAAPLLRAHRVGQQSLVTNRDLLTKVWFPRLLIPVSTGLAGLADFALAFLVLLGMMAYYGIVPTAAILFLPAFAARAHERIGRISCATGAHEESGGTVNDQLRALLRLDVSAVRRVGRIRFGDLRRTEPISREFGFDRGAREDRYCIEGFLNRCASDIRGHVLEVSDTGYTRRFGGDRAQKPLRVDARRS